MKKGWVFLVFLLINISYISAAVLFESEWNYSTGTNDTVVRDGGKWNTAGANNQLTGVVQSAGLDFPTTNALEIVVNSAGLGRVIRYTGLPVLGVGENRYYRWYFRVTVPDDLNSTVGDAGTHPIQDGNAIGDSNWAFNVGFDYDNGGIWYMDFNILNISYPLNRWWVPTLQKNVTYRFELNLYRNNETHFQMHPRVYASNGTLLYDDGDFTHTDSSNTLAQLNPFFPIRYIDNTNGLNSGFNGLTSPSRQETLYYEAAFCVRDDTWCGAYGAASNPADLNTDDKVDFSDILIIIRRILGLNSNTAADMNNDGAVNIFDLVNASRLFGKQYGTDTTAPTITSSRPTNNTNLSAGATQTVLFAETNERATCRYLNTTGGSFATMNNFTRTGRISHSIQLTGLTDGTTYNYYIQCQDEAGNLNSTDYHVRFGVNSNAGVLFSSDWSTALGTSDAALRDGAKWNTSLNNGGGGEIIVSDGLDFPTANVLRVTAVWNGGGAYGVLIQRTDAWTVPNVGESLYFRWYVRQVVPDTVHTGSVHPIQDGENAGVLNWHLAPESPRTSTWQIKFGVSSNAIPNNWWLGSQLNKSQTYRVELNVTRTGTTTYQLHPYVYDTSNNLIADPSDFDNNANPSTGTLADNPDLTIDTLNSMAELMVGSNGGFGNVGNTADQFPFIYLYEAAICVRNDTWCGPYNGGI